MRNTVMAVAAVLLLISACETTPSIERQVLEKPDFLYARGDILVERYTHYSQSTYTGKAVAQHTLVVHRSEVQLYRGEPRLIPRSVTRGIAKELENERSFVAIDAYGVKLNDNIENYPDFDFTRIDTERMLKVFKKRDTGLFDWDLFIALTDANGVIKELSLYRVFENTESVLRFFNATHDAINDKYARVLTQGSIVGKVRAEIASRNDTSPPQDLGENDILCVYGVDSAERFFENYYYHFINQMDRLYAPALDDEFLYIINDCLKSIVLARLKNTRTVSLTMTTVDDQANQDERDEAILKNF